MTSKIQGENMLKKEGIYISRDEIVCEEVLCKMEKMGFNRDCITKQIEDKEYNNITTTFYSIFRRVGKEPKCIHAEFVEPIY